MNWKILFCGIALLIPGGVLPAASPVFVQDGRLLIVRNGGPAVLEALDSRAGAVDLAKPVSAYWGTLIDDRLLVTIKGDTANHTLTADDHHCSTHDHPEEAWLLNPDGTLDAALSTNTLRAFPSPTGDLVALISPDRDLLLWHDGEATTVTAPGRVSNVGWSPDGTRMVASIYPLEWTQGGVSSASTTAEFLHLQNADLYLFDIKEMKFVGQLTSDPGTEYGPFFSLEGNSLYYTWLHATEDAGGLMRLDLDRDNGTSASAPAVKLTNAGNDPGETPLGRVGTYLWRESGTRLVFESGLPDGSGEIWTMSAQGKEPVKIGSGRKPQALNDTEIMFMNNSGQPETINPQVQP